MQAVSDGGTSCSLVDCLPLVADGEDIDFVGATGEIAFDNNGDPSGAFYEVWRFNDSGDFETVTVIDAASL
jgi:branched-chain amino acid transport system substrate-binding protein